MSDLGAIFDAHVRAEFQDLDLDATMATMSPDPYVHHLPTITGGNGAADVREFYEPTGAEQAESLLDRRLPKNELLEPAA